MELLIKTDKAKEKFRDNHFHNISRIFDVLPNFFSSQAKRCTIITYKHGIYELPDDLPNDNSLMGGSKCPHKTKKLRILGN